MIYQLGTSFEDPEVLNGKKKRLRRRIFVVIMNLNSTSRSRVYNDYMLGIKKNRRNKNKEGNPREKLH